MNLGASNTLKRYWFRRYVKLNLVKHFWKQLSTIDWLALNNDLSTLKPHCIQTRKGTNLCLYSDCSQNKVLKAPLIQNYLVWLWASTITGTKKTTFFWSTVRGGHWSINVRTSLAKWWYFMWRADDQIEAQTETALVQSSK